MPTATPMLFCSGVISPGRPKSDSDFMHPSHFALRCKRHEEPSSADPIGWVAQLACISLLYRQSLQSLGLYDILRMNVHTGPECHQGIPNPSSSRRVHQVLFPRTQGALAIHHLGSGSGHWFQQRKRRRSGQIKNQPRIQGVKVDTATVNPFAQPSGESKSLTGTGRSCNIGDVLGDRLCQLQE